ncbi:MAG: hypothetical protein ACSHXW_09010 [Yoonia sp.]
MTLFRISGLLIGIGEVQLYGPAILLLILFEAVRGNLSIIRFGPFLVFGCWLIIFTFVFTIGYSHLTLVNPWLSALKLSALFFIFGLAFSNRSQLEKHDILLALVLGILIQSMAIIGYSIGLNYGFYGYGNLYNPLSGSEVNSPLVGIKMAIVSGVAIHNVVTSDRLLLRCICITVIFLLVVGAIMIASRAFFVLFTIALLWSLSRKFTIKNLILMTTVFVISYQFMMSWLTTSESLKVAFDFFILRFSNGLESDRFDLYAIGLSNLSNYPFGGFGPPQEAGFNELWYHNILLDLGRVAGVIPIFFFLLFTLIVFWAFLTNVSMRNKSVIALIFLLCWLASMQDVLLEGDHTLLLLLYLSGVALTDRTLTKVRYGDHRRNLTIPRCPVPA